MPPVGDDRDVLDASCGVRHPQDEVVLPRADVAETADLVDDGSPQERQSADVVVAEQTLG